MNVVIAKNNEKEDIEMRVAYCQTLIDLAKENEEIVTVDADVMNSMGTTGFRKAFPERSINCGIQEANMIGVAAGLSATGKIPFAHTFGVFATRRVYDQIFVSCAYAKLNVKIVGGDPGITAAFNGGTHMPFEDMGIMRNIPEVTIIEPIDSTMIKDLTRQMANSYGTFYMRIQRKTAIKVYEEGSVFEIGKAAQIRDGKDATIIATGLLVAETIKAADILGQKGISVRILNMFTLKPIDKEAILKAAEETGAIVTAENHNIINGLGSAVSEVLAENTSVPMERIGVKDIFGEVGSEDYLKERFELTANDIVKKVEEVMKRKNKQS
jgi:transketolase